MANEQELLTLEEKRKLWRDYEKSDPNKALPWSDVVAEAQVAKLKAMGYEQVWEICPDCHDLFLYRRKCTTCKGTGKITNKVEWNREKVAKLLYSENEPTLIYDGVTFDKCREIYPEKVESYLEQADQLKEELTGGKE